MGKQIRKMICVILSFAMILCLMPGKVALAAGTTINNIRAITHDANANEIEFSPKATLVFDTATFAFSDVNGEMFIYLENNTYYGDVRNPDMEDGYDISITYIPNVFCVKSGELIEDTSYSAMLTVPIPEGYDGSTAKVIRMFDMLNEDDDTKKPVSSYTDTTVTVPLKLKYWEDPVTDDNGVVVDVGGFGSHVSVEFKKKTDITPLKESVSLAATTYEYTGSVIEPVVSITGLTKDKDYTVSYSSNINVGDAKATVTGKNLYKGNFELPFTITPMPIAKKQAVATLPANEFKYTGQAIEPKVTIAGLAEGTDFTVAYDKNVDPGTATTTITGIGNYKDTFTLEFTIKKEPENLSIKDSKTGAAYSVTTTGDTSEATYDSAKSKNEKTVKIPDAVKLRDGTKVKVTAIAKNACKGNKKLTKATIGNNVKTIGDNAFNGCSNLTNLKFGKKVEKIGKGAARNCKKLKKVNLPASTKTIGNNAFDGDSNLKEMTVNCKNLKSVGKNAIRKINPNAVIKLKGSAKEKKAAEKLITNKKTGYKKTMKIKK